MVRDPVERLVSWFYYVRAAWSVKIEEEKLLLDVSKGTSWIASKPSPKAPFPPPTGCVRLSTSVLPTRATWSVNTHRWDQNTHRWDQSPPRTATTFLLQDSFGGFEDHRRQSIFFCGHHPDCVPFNSQRANQLAKRVVEEHYAVVKDYPL